jgi:hypothetical protein
MAMVCLLCVLLEMKFKLGNFFGKHSHKFDPLMSYGNVLSNQRVIINRLVYFIHVRKENYVELDNFQKRFPHINKLERLYVSINMDHQFTQLLCSIGVSYASYKVVMRPKHLLINLIYLDIVLWGIVFFSN